MMETNQSPVPTRKAVCHDELSPISPVILEGYSNKLDSMSRQVESLNIPCVSSCEVIRVKYENEIDGKQHRFFQRATRSTTEIFPSDIGVEVAASSGGRVGPRTPTFQRRGRFLIWPATCGQDQVLQMGSRA